jgi:osmoprotectant transport system permease protein
LKAALQPLIGAISVGEMQKANLSVDRDRGKVTPGDAAKALESLIRR